jgi:hypothetical protein
VQPVQSQAEPASTFAGEDALGVGNPLPTQAEPVQLVPPKRPARGPPLWDESDTQAGEGVGPAPDWDEATQVAPDIAVDQRGEQWWQRFCQRCGEGLRLSPPQAGHADKSQAPSPVQAPKQTPICRLVMPQPRAILVPIRLDFLSAPIRCEGSRGTHRASGNDAKEGSKHAD